MKTIKRLFWLIVLALLGLLIYQNHDYFLTTVRLTLDLEVASLKWAIPELQNIAYFGICFVLGLLLAGIKGLFAKMGLKGQIKIRDNEIHALKEQVNTLKLELDVFKHDPYIKNRLKDTRTISDPAEPAIETPGPERKNDISESEATRN